MVAQEAVEGLGKARARDVEALQTDEGGETRNFSPCYGPARLSREILTIYSPAPAGSRAFITSIAIRHPGLDSVEAGPGGRRGGYDISSAPTFTGNQYSSIAQCRY